MYPKNNDTKNAKGAEEVEKEDDENVPIIRCRHYLLPIIILLAVFGGSCLDTTDTQYAYFAIQRERNITSVLSNSRQSLCESNTTSPLFKQQQEVQSETARWNAYCHLASSFPALIMATMMGSWSDKIGRKYSLLIPIGGLIFKSTFYAFAIRFQWNIYLFPIANFVEGVSGMWMSTIAAAYSFAADLTKYGKSRTFGIVLVEISLGVGVTTGILSSGYLIKFIGFFYASVFVAVLALGICLLISLLPETVQSRKKLTSSSQIQYLRIAVSFYTKKGPLRWKYIIFICVFALSVLANIGKRNVSSLYVMNSPFCWNSVLIGIFGSTRTFTEMIVGVGIYRLMFLCMTEKGMVIAGSVSAIASYVLITLAINDVMLFLSIAVGIIGHLPIVMIRAIMSGMTPKDKQGAMFGGLAAVQAVSSLVGSVVSNLLYSETVLVYKGTIWLVFAGFHTIALC